MNKKILLFILAVFLPVIIFVSVITPLSNTEIDYEKILDPNFEITNYYIEAKADSNRNVHIIETIDVKFLFPRSSIIRDIPVSNGLQIKNIKSPNRQISVEKYGSFLAVDLDSENFVPTTGAKTYIISYTMVLPKLKGAENSIPLNIIGHGWGVPIKSAEIDITLPNYPVQSYYYVGDRGITEGIDRINITNNNNKINIQTKDTLQPFEGITIGYDLPQGTLKTPLNISVIPKIIIALFIIALAYLLYVKYGKDEQIMPIVNFTANGINPAETGYLIDGNCAPSDITSLIYYWASKGYLNIIDNKNSDNISLERVRPLDSSHKRYEHTMFNELFKKGNLIKVSSLKNNFYTSIAQTKESIKQEYFGKLHNNKSFALSIIVTLLPVLFAGIAIFISGLSISSSFYNPTGFMLIVPSAIIYVAGTLLFKKEPKLDTNKNLYYILYAALVLACSLIMNFIFRNNFVSKIAAMVYAATFGVVMCVAPFVQKRTAYYHEILNNLTGFRNFIKEAEKERLELLLKDNPQYYYDILPYANVLGVSDIWMKKFQGITLEPPYWYRSYRPFDLIIFNAAFSRSINTITTTAVSRPPSQNGRGGGGFGGSIGGGFGGGGFGGGGGRSR